MPNRQDRIQEDNDHKENRSEINDKPTLQQRHEIDNTTVRSLLVINGGGAVALLTFLGNIFDKNEADDLYFYIISGMALFCIGLLTASIHNTLRRTCNAYHAKRSIPRNAKSPGDTEACKWSWRLQYLSMICFALACAIVIFGGFDSLV